MEESEPPQNKKRSVIQRLSSGLRIYMPIVVLVVAAMALFAPVTSTWVQAAWINPLLMVIMFGMGVTMKPAEFAVVFKRPKDVLIGIPAQYIIMPLLAFAIGKALGLETALLAGLVLVGTCPGGTASDVMAYLAKGDVALTVSITAVNTLLAPILTPLTTLILLQTTVSVDVAAMFISIIQVVIVPIVLGLLIGHFFDKLVKRAAIALPFVSMIAICLIIMAVVSHNVAQIMTAGASIMIAVVLLNLAGYGFGWLVAKLTKMPLPRRKAMALEIGMQNSGMATSLAMTVFPGMVLASVPGAIFSVWHNISGSLLAAFFRRFEEKQEK